MGGTASREGARALNMNVPDERLNPKECTIRANALIEQDDGSAMEEQVDWPRVARLLQRAADTGDADAAFSLALMYQGNPYLTCDLPQDMERAIALYHIAIDGGNPIAMSNLGVVLHRGIGGVPVDGRAAVHLFERSRDAGNVDAIFNLALLYRQGMDGVPADALRAVRLYREAIDKGHVAAHGSLANVLTTGAEGVSRDVNAAVELLETATGKGDDHAMFLLALLLYRGEENVLVADIPRAVQLLRDASESGHTDAMTKLANILSEGAEGVSQDVAEAKSLYETASNFGNTRAMFLLAQLLDSCEDQTKEDEQRAIYLYNTAADRGHTAAKVQLAYHLQIGRDGVERDCQAAITMYEDAIADGDDHARFLLGNLYRTGAEGVKPDTERAVQLLRAAVDGGHVRAIVQLADLFSEGCGAVEKDERAAAELYDRAVKCGSAVAMFHLAALHRRGYGEENVNYFKAVELYRKACALDFIPALTELGCLLLFGNSEIRRDIAGAQDLFERSWQLGDRYGGVQLAKLLLWDDRGSRREPLRAAQILRSVCEGNGPVYIPAAHELAILLQRGEDGVPRDTAEAARLHGCVQDGTYGDYPFDRTNQLVFEAGAKYPALVKEALAKGDQVSKKCLLLALGGGHRGKTCTVNSLRGLPFVQTHRPTEMANIVSELMQPNHSYENHPSEAQMEDIDFLETSMYANTSRLDFDWIRRNDCSVQPSPSSTEIEVSPARRRDDEAMKIVERNATHPHADVIERARRALVERPVPRGFYNLGVQIWDMAGQMEYEMAHSLFIARANVIMFVTDLSRVSNPDTRTSEVRVLCQWMELAYTLLPDPDAVGVLVVGTRKGQCPDDGGPALQTLQDELAEQLLDVVYNAWVLKRAIPSEDGDEHGSDSEQDVMYSNAVFLVIENSASEHDEKGSGLNTLAYKIEVCAFSMMWHREGYPIRWYAFIDKLNRMRRSCFTRAQILEISVEFPGLPEAEDERETDLLAGLRAFASMGMVVLFELSPVEWYVFKNVEDVVHLVGMTVKPDATLKQYLNREERRSLNNGFLSKQALFKLWGRRTEEEKELALKLLIEYDLLMELRGKEPSTQLIGVPALFDQGCDGLKWGRAPHECDLTVTTAFETPVPIGFVGRLMSFLHRMLGAEIPSSDMVRQDAALVCIRDSGRMFVRFKRVERRMEWTFRAAEPVALAKRCLRHIDVLLGHKQRGINASHTHSVSQNCSEPPRGCGASGGICVNLPSEWIRDEMVKQLPTEAACCSRCGVEFSINLCTGAIAPDVAVVPREKYDVFISHAGPDKFTLAKPLYSALKNIGLNVFLDKEELACSSTAAPDVMVQAMCEARLGIFILSPEFAARRWPMKELCTFLRRNRETDGPEKPALLPVFFRLPLGETSGVYGAPEHEHIMEQSHFVSGCSPTERDELEAAMRAIKFFTGVEVPKKEGVAQNESAAVVEAIVESVHDFVVRNSF